MLLGVAFFPQGLLGVDLGRELLVVELVSLDLDVDVSQVALHLGQLHPQTVILVVLPLEVLQLRVALR